MKDEVNININNKTNEDFEDGYNLDIDKRDNI